MTTARSGRRVFRTPQEAFEAGLNEPCKHGAHVATDCRHCRLTPAEISSLAVLLKACLRPTAQSTETAA